MADQTDVAAALVQLIAAGLYPNGITSPSVVRYPVKVFQGWPTPQTLQADFALSTIDVSVYPLPTARLGPFLPVDKDLANNGTTGTTVTMLRREIRQFQITIWASCFDMREPVAKAVDTLLAQVNRITLADGQLANIAYVNSRQSDDDQKQGLYRRDLVYECDYATTLSTTNYVIKQTILNESIGPTLAIQGPVHTVTVP